MTYKPDHYHQTNPPTELKRDVMGRKGSKKNKVSADKQSNSAPSSVRSSFEKWISSPPFEMMIDRYPADCPVAGWPDSYVSCQVDLAWQAWKTAHEYLDPEQYRTTHDWVKT